MVLTSQVPYKAAKQNLARGTNMEATSFRIAIDICQKYFLLQVFSAGYIAIDYS